MSGPGGRAAVSSRPPEQPTDWEDAFYRLKAQHEELKVDYNEKENHNRLLQAKLSKLENELRQMGRTGGMSLADREERDAIESLHDHIAKLKSANSSLATKNKSLIEQLEKKKRELVLAKRPTARKAPPAAQATGEVDVVPGRTSRNEPLVPPTDNSGSEWMEIAKKLKIRLEAAEEQLRKLREDNDKLRSANTAPRQSVGESAENIDAKWRLQQLQTQYDYLVSKTAAQNEASKHADYKIEEYHQKVKELRRSLEELRHEKELSDSKAARVESLEEIVSELRQTNRSLEEKIARLCEAPFISDAFGQHEVRLKYEDLMQEREDLLAKVEHLQEAVRTHFSALTSLKQHASQLREEKEEAERKAEEMRISLQELQAGTNLLQDQLRLYSGDDGVDVEMLERALTMVKRSTEPLAKLPFLEDPEGEKLVALPAVKRKLEEYQLLNLKLTEENERLENMLKLQTGISRDLHKEVEALVRNRDKDKAALEQKAADFEEIALKRLDKIHALEAQVRQFVYGLAKNSKGGRSGGAFNMVTPDKGDGEEEDMDGDVDHALLQELMEMNGGEVREDENLLEIWIKGASIREGVLTPGSSCFVVIDFFDYESQTTSLLSGLKPQWDFAATYQLTVDDFLLRYFATDVVTLELNMASQGDFTMLARCTLPISALLKSRPRLQLVNHPMLSVKTGQTLANITLDLRLALPVSELYRLFLERHPTEKKHIEELSAKRVIEAASHNELARNIDGGLATGREDESRLYNELEVIVHRAHGLPACEDGTPPTAYTHFQLLGHPDKLTNPVANTTEPEFNEKFTFPMVTTDQQLRLVQRSKLLMSLIDMRGEEMRLKHDGLIGEVYIGMAQLVEGSPVHDTFTIKDVDGKKAGELFVTIKWRYTLKKERDLGPRALSGMDVEILLSAFAPDEFQEGVVDYRAFCRFCDPPVQVLHAMDKLRAFSTDLTEREGKTSREVFQLLLDEERDIDEDYFVQRMLKTQVDVLPMDLVKLFHHIDNAQEGRITIDKFLAVMNLDEIAGIPVLLQNKLRERSIDLTGRGIPAVQLFEEADQWGPNGLVTRQEFKTVLKRMGFSLPDEPDPLHAYVGDDPDRAGAGAGAGAGGRKKGKVHTIEEEDENDMLNDTMGSEDHIIAQNDLVAAASGGAGDAAHPPAGSSGAGGGGGGTDSVMRQQREIFEAKRAELQQRSQQALERDAQQRTATGQHDPLRPGEGPDPYGGHDDHRVSVGGSDRSGFKHLDLDPAVSNMYATKLQSRYRGYQVRRSGRPDAGAGGGGEGGVRTNATGIAVPSSDDRSVQEQVVHSLVGASNILAVENELYSNLRGLAGENQSLPDLATGFLKVDQKRTGLVNRKQFAHVLQQYPAVKLYGADLRAAMDFFDVAQDGNSIDYNAFLRFFHYKGPELIPAIQKLQTMTLRKSVIKQFRELDQTGQGYIRRVDMLRCLKELGHIAVSQSVMQTMLQLFETRQDGMVNYLNFFEYVRESELTQNLEHLSVQLFQLFTTNAAADADRSTREWYNRIDRSGKGIFSMHDLAAFIEAHDLPCAKEAIVALYTELDPEGLGVGYGRFSSWLKEVAHNQQQPNSELALYSTLSLAELQRKANTYVVAVAGSPNNVEDLTDSFLVYDWRRSDAGAMAKPLFVRATRRAGFPFTMSELRTLTSEFSLSADGEVVSYKQFLRWATPTNRVAAGMSVSEQVPFQALHAGTPAGDGVLTAPIQEAGIPSAGAPQRHAGAVVRFLEKALERGIDLLSVFGRYDSISVGRITASEFCAAVSDLGLSSLAEREALEVADRFRAAAGEFVLYRRIVTELLRQADEATGAADVDPVEVVRAALQLSRVEVRRLREVFEYYDRKGNGNVRREDVPTIFDESKLRIKRFEIDVVCDKFAMGTSDWISYRPLLKALEQRLTERSLVGRSKVGIIPDEVSAKVKALIETLIIRGKDYRFELDKFDESYSGTVLQSDFRAVLLERFDCGFTNRDFEALEKNFRSKTDPRRVDYVRLLHHLHPRNFGRVTFESVDGIEGEPYEIAEDLRQKIRRRCDYAVPGELRRPFKHFARQADHRTVTRDDFSLAVRNLGMRLAADQEKSVFDMIALSGGNTFKYNDFAVFVCDPQHIDIIWKLRRGIAKSRVSEKEIINALNEQDTNSSGLITAKQFLRALSHCGIDLSDTDALRLMLRFDVEDNQRFDIDRFCRFLRGRQVDDDMDAAELDQYDVAVMRRIKAEDAAALTASRRTKPDDSVESHAWGSLKRRVEQKLELGYTGSEVFAMFDADGQGSLDVASLHRGSQKLGLTLTQPEARSMMRRMTMLAGGSEVSKASFFEALRIDLRVFSAHDGELSSNERGRRRRVPDKDYVEDSWDPSRDRDPKGWDRDRDRSKDLDRDRDRDRDSSYYDDREREEDWERGRKDRGFDSVMARIKDQLQVSVNPRDRAELPEVTRRALEKVGLQREGKVTPRELSRALDALGVRVPNREVLNMFDLLDTAVTGLLAHGDVLAAIFGERYRDTAEDDGSGGPDRSGSDVHSALRKRPDLVEDIIGAIKSFTTDYSKVLHDLKLEFKVADFDRKNAVGKAEFARCLNHVGIKLPGATERDLVDTLTHNSASDIQYLDFINVIERSTGVGRGADFRAGGSGNENTNAIIRTIRQTLQDRLGPGASSARRMKETFAEIDSDHSGSIDRREFNQAMLSLRVELTRGEVDALFDRFDMNGRGLDYREFIELIGFDTAPSSAHRPRVDATDAVTKAIKRKLENKLGPGRGSASRIKETFATMDVDHSGIIDKREFEKAMRVLDVDVDRVDIDALYARHAKDGRGLDYREFIDLIGFEGDVRGRSSSRALDDPASIRDRDVRDRDSASLRDDTEVIIKAIRRGLEDHLGPGANSARRIKETFSEIDRDRSGLIDKREFAQALNILRVDVGRSDIDLLFQRFDKNERGLDYREFIDLIGFSGAGSAAAVEGGRGIRDRDDRRISSRLREDTDTIIKTIKRRLDDYLGPGASSARRIKETFSEIDRDRSGSIEKREFVQAMKVLRVDVDRQDTDMLFERFDKDGHGLDYSEFIDMIGFGAGAGAGAGSGRSKDDERVSSRLREDTDLIIKTVQRRLEDYLGPGASSARRIKETFSEIDRDRSGSIDKREFAQAMRVLKVDITGRDIDMLFERFDVNGRGLDYSEFIDLIGFGSGSGGGVRISTGSASSFGRRGDDFDAKLSAGAPPSSRSRGVDFDAKSSTSSRYR